MYRSMRRVDETVINYDLIEDVLDALLLQNSSVFAPPLARGGNSEEQLSNKLIPILGSVLIFLPGLEEIRTLLERLSGSRKFGNIERFKIVPLHSTLSSSEQRRAFIPSAPGCIKIIISTNVAETSVTIPDVVYVIDSGRVREIKRDNKTNSRKLVATWCSKASVKQRSGRAGRVQPGVCLKLYSSCTENRVMKNATEPELQRIPLDEVCLCILAGGFGKSCSDFLSQTPQPPSDDAVRSALNGLEDIGAIESNNSSSSVTPMNRSETLTSLGRHLAKLPVDARVGKMLIFGTLFRCTDAILTIAASLSVSKSPFLSALGDRQEIKSVRAQFSHPFSDFLTYVNVWNGYRDAESRGLGKSFCREKFLNYSAMREIQDARRHYLELLKGLGFLNLASLADESGKRTFDEKFTSSRYNKNSNLEYLVHGVVYASLFPNVAHLDRTGASVDATVTHKTELLFIQSSVNSKLHNFVLPSSWITYYEKFGTERRVSISTTAFISPFCLMLFGSKLQVLHAERRICIDGWIEITAPAKTGVIFQEIQSRLTDFLSSIFNKSCEFSDLTALVERIEKVIDLVVTLLSKGQG
jgi:HrpA-like RNA helicase